MLGKIVEELNKIVEEVKSPFSYIHDKLVEAFEHTHKKLEELDARIDVLEFHAGVAAPYGNQPLPVDLIGKEVEPGEPKAVPPERAGGNSASIIDRIEALKLPDVDLNSALGPEGALPASGAETNK